MAAPYAEAPGAGDIWVTCRRIGMSHCAVVLHLRWDPCAIVITDLNGSAHTNCVRQRTDGLAYAMVEFPKIAYPYGELYESNCCSNSIHVCLW